MSNSSIAQSEIINIPKETKVEVVLTLNAYPLVLDKIDLTETLLESCNKINTILEEQVNTQKDQIFLLESKEENHKEQLRLLKRQLKKEKLKGLKIGGIGLITIVAIILVK